MLMVSRFEPGAGSSSRINEPPGGDVMPNSFWASSIKSFSLFDLRLHTLMANSSSTLSFSMKLLDLMALHCLLGCRGSSTKNVLPLPSPPDIAPIFPIEFELSIVERHEENFSVNGHLKLSQVDHKIIDDTNRIRLGADDSLIIEVKLIETLYSPP